MTSNKDTSWMPTGRHKFNIGSSLSVALKTRKGIQSRRNNNLPVRDFYSFRYNFKPNSLDLSKPGNIEVNTKKESTTVAVEHASVQPGEAHAFSGLENPAGELDCVLIYDEEMGSFTLEKLDSYITLQHEKKITSTLSPSKPSPVSVTPSPPEPPPAPAAPAPKIELDVEDDDDLGADFDSALEALQSPSENKRNKQEPEEEMFEDFLAPDPPPPPAKKIEQPKKVEKKSKIAPPGKLKKRASPPPPPPPQSNRHPDTEDLDFGRPAQPAPKKRRMSGEGLALPGSSFSSGFVQPLPSYNPPGPLPPAPVVPEESDEDDDMVEVAATGALQLSLSLDDGQDADLDIFGSEIEDEMANEMENELENEMNLAFEDEEDDFLTSTIPTQDDDNGGAGGGGKIMSLSELAENVVSDDDDFSSSDDSDDD